MSLHSSQAGMNGLETAKASSPVEVGSMQPLHVIEEQVTDSGYSSTISTPDKSIDPNNHDVRTKSEQRPIPARLSALAKLAPRKAENKKTLLPGLEVDDASRESYARIQPHFERQLREYILAHPKRGEPCYPLWIRLLMVGTTTDDPEVHIVVFCKPKYKEVVQRFFRADHVTELCGGPGAGGKLFKLHVEGIAPRLRHETVEVIAETPSVFRDTFCGTPISLKHPSGRIRNATLGGVVKVVNTDGEFRLYGISAGHAVQGLEYEEDETSEEEHDFVEHGPDSSFQCLSETSASTAPTPSDSWTFTNPEVVGISVQIPLLNTSAASKRHDWALFNMTDYRPNEVKGERGQINALSPKPPGQTGSRDVYFVSGSGPHGPHDVCKKGVLSPEKGRIALDSSLEFFDTYIFTVGDESGIHNGDSGSWVIDCQTLKLYGHIVATGFLDEGIVVPMNDIFEDIKEQFEAASVDLASDIDVFSSSQVVAELTTSAAARDESFDVLNSPIPDSGYESKAGSKSFEVLNAPMPDSGYGSAVSSPSALAIRSGPRTSVRRAPRRSRLRDCVVM